MTEATNELPRWRGSTIFFGGPVIWALQLFVGYGLASLACGASRVPYLILDGAAVLLILAAGYLAYQSWKRLADEAHPRIGDVDTLQGASTFVATAGFLVSVLFFWLTLLTTAIAFFVLPCPLITMPFP